MDSPVEVQNTKALHSLQPGVSGNVSGHTHVHLKEFKRRGMNKKTTLRKIRPQRYQSCPMDLSSSSSNASFTPSRHSPSYHYFISAGVRAWTTLVPSINLVLKMRFAFVNMPSFKLTTMN